jgi:hypothetical protein
MRGESAMDERVGAAEMKAREKVEWVRRRFPEGDPRRAIPEWARCVAVRAGVVFIPGYIGDERHVRVFMLAGADGAAAIFDDEGHGYYPASWIAATFPEARETASRIERETWDWIEKNPA